MVLLIDRFLKSPQLEQYRDLYMPSTGALMLLAALHTCDQVNKPPVFPFFFLSLKFLLIKAFYLLLEWPQNLLVQLLLNRCCACWVFPQVSAYGFITENYEDFSDHYYDKEIKPLVFYANHDMEMEGRLWKQLHSQNVLRLYQRQKRTWYHFSEWDKTGNKTA